MPQTRPFVSALWHAKPANLQPLLAQTIRAGIEAHAARSNSFLEKPKIYFRADDVALPTTLCKQMLTAFAKHNTPLSLAVVPAWITPEHKNDLLSTAPDKEHLWCWHQHGWAHANNAATGKKCEFGEGRSAADCTGELVQGYEWMQEVFGTTFQPLFTPPWNRISSSNVQILKDIGFTAISTFANSAPQTILPDFPMHIDLHTRPELTASEGWRNFFAELEAGIASGSCGIMLHHERMNDDAVDFLHCLLITLKSYPVQTVPIYASVL